jgi:hypothetical protein
MAPGPVIGPQKNIGTLLCPMGCYKTQGSKSASHRGLTARADHEKRHPPGFSIRGSATVCQPSYGVMSHQYRGITAAVPTIEIKGSRGKEPDLA